jgi:excisionase family DNA binding protein
MAQSTVEPLLTPDEVAAVLGIPKTTLFRWRVDSKGPKGIRVGKHLRFRPSEISRWLDEHTDTRGAA